MATHQDVVCPFCGLGCDDLTVDVDAGGIAGGIMVRSTDCPIARDRFGRVHPVEPPRVAGAAVTLEDAVRAAAAVLDRSEAPLIGGLAADVEGVRAAIELGERVGAVLDHEWSDGLYRNLSVLQRTGWMTTTFAELRNRCDLLLVAGSDPAAFHPRFYERWVTPPPAFQDPATREVLFLPGDTAQVGHTAAALAAALAEPEPTGVVADVAALAQRLRKARYAVVAWSAGGFSEPHADLTVEALVRLVRAVNRHTRCAGLPLGGQDNVIGANQVCTWQLGVPLRSSLAGGVPLHDPHRFAWTRFLDTADAVVWISAFRPEVPSFPPGKTVVALAPPGTVFATEPAVFIPIGTPGIDHAAHLFRGDTVVALRTGRLIDRGLPDVAAVLRAVLDSLPPRTPARTGAC